MSILSGFQEREPFIRKNGLGSSEEKLTDKPPHKDCLGLTAHLLKRLRK
jgi:hypothetical protein